jgi:hypothetical protein
MDKILGPGNTIPDYLLVLFIYGLVFLLIFYTKNKIELNERTSFLVLYIFWSLAMFIGNYIGFLCGVMAFLPWLDNLMHSFGWVGFGLAWLYFSSRGLPWYYRFFLSGMFSFLIKFAEHLILGTWTFDPYFFFTGAYAYIVIMAIVDGFYPLVSDLLLNWLHNKFPAVYTAENP